MKILCCDLSNSFAGIFGCGGKTRKPPESARKCSDSDRGPEPAVSHGMAVGWEVTSLLWYQRGHAGMVPRAAGSVLPVWNPAGCCGLCLHCACHRPMMLLWVVTAGLGATSSCHLGH